VGARGRREACGAEATMRTAGSGSGCWGTVRARAATARDGSSVWGAVGTGARLCEMGPPVALQVQCVRDAVEEAAEEGARRGRG
jgi:hypothetical protein